MLKIIFCNRLRSCENAIGVMTKLQTSLVAEESWVDGAAEKLASLPTATSAYELDVSISLVPKYYQNHIEILLSYYKVFIVRKHRHFLDFRNHLLIMSYTSHFSYHSLVYQNLFSLFCVYEFVCKYNFIDLSNIFLYLILCVWAAEITFLYFFCTNSKYKRLTQGSRTI